MFKMPRMPLPPSRRSVAGALVAIALAAVVFLVLPSGATPARKIVIYGANSGSTLTLSKKHNGRLIVVKGNMAHQRPRGCHFTRGHRKAVCRTRGALAIEIQMGPHGDLVRVADKMPMPVVVYLGPGSDKFVGNAERDICFSGGARRNRCVGRGGNDVCITGNRNSDCLGGGGNDFCRHGRGSDGCHGGPGRDRLYGGPGADQLYGGRGFDYCNGQRGWGKSHNCNVGSRR